MAYEPRLIAPFEQSGLNKYYKPWLVGKEAFPEISDSYPWRGNVRKREGFRFIAAYPAGDKPVMGLRNYVDPRTLGESLIGFSRTKAYLFNGSTFSDITFEGDGTAFSFTAGVDNYFWSSNYASSMWVTDNLTADNVQYWNGSPSLGWSRLKPIVHGTTTMDAALMILPYKGRLVALNTTESTDNLFQSRARWSQIGTPYAGSASPTANQAITLGDPTTTIQSNLHGLETGDNVSFINFTGVDAGLINTVNFVATRIDNNNFTIPLKSLGKDITVNTSFTQQLGVPPTPFINDINAWRDDIPGKGGFNDADTSERIVSAAILKDTLIVAFQRSTWRLRYTGNEVLPFIWERLNTQYGAESTFSCISFDEHVLFFSRFGWIAATTNDVQRIDMTIPDDSFAIESTSSTAFEGMTRVHGIRDYFRQFAYWTYQSQGSDVNDLVYAYNYLDKSWTTFSFLSANTPPAPIGLRTFGYFRLTQDTEWQDLNTPGPNPPKDSWENYNSSSSTWSSFGQTGDNFPYVVSGDADGNVYQMFEFIQSPASDNGVNFPFSIKTKSFNPYIDQGRKCRLAYCDLYCTTGYGGQITVNHFVDDKTVPIFTRKVSTFSRSTINISNVNVGTINTVITTATNHGLVTGQNVTIGGIVGSVGNILNNQTYAVQVITNKVFLVPASTSGTSYVSSGFIYGEDLVQGLAKYTRIYLGAIAHFHQLQFTVSQDQLIDPIAGAAQFEMQGLVMWTRPEGRIRG